MCANILARITRLHFVYEKPVFLVVEYKAALPAVGFNSFAAQYTASTENQNNNLIGSIKMEVVPPCSGLAEIDLKYEDQSIQVRPSTAFIRPLSLESSNLSCSPYKRTKSNRNLQLITI